VKKLITDFISEDRGSASVEFIALAIPLFLPLFIYINSFASMSDGQDSLRTLAREAARGFVTSSTDEIGFYVANEILSKGSELLGYGEALKNGEIQMQIDCSQQPCISPNASIRVTLMRSEKERPVIKVSALAYVSPWA
jgi:hypothetical protein